MTHGVASVAIHPKFIWASARSGSTRYYGAPDSADGAVLTIADAAPPWSPATAGCRRLPVQELPATRVAVVIAVDRIFGAGRIPPGDARHIGAREIDVREVRTHEGRVGEVRVGEGRESEVTPIQVEAREIQARATPRRRRETLRASRDDQRGNAVLRGSADTRRTVRVRANVRATGCPAVTAGAPQGDTSRGRDRRGGCGRRGCARAGLRSLAQQAFPPPSS